MTLKVLAQAGVAAGVMGAGVAAQGPCHWLTSPLPFDGSATAATGPAGSAAGWQGRIAGGVGPDHAVVVTDALVWMRGRLGTMISDPPMSHEPPGVDEALPDFFNQRAAASLGLSLTRVYSPSVRYDRLWGRWYIVALGIDDNAASPNDWKIVVAASDAGADPRTASAWSVHAADVDAGNAAYAAHLTFGFNERMLAVAATVHDLSAGAFLRNGMWVFAQGAMHSQGNPVAATDLGIVAGFGFGNGLPSVAMCPAVSLDWSAAGQPLYIVDYSGLTLGGAPKYRLSQISEGGANGYEWSCVPGSVYNAATGAGEVGLFESTTAFSTGVPAAAQFGSAQTIETCPLPGRATVQDCVVRNGSIWFAHTAGWPAVAPDRSVVVWQRVGALGWVPGTADEGGVIDGGPGVWHFAPALAVNCRGDAAVGFARSGAAEHASAAWAVRGAIDAPGTVRGVEIARSGQAVYEDPGAGSAAWGGWSSAGVDPADDQGFWMICGYADSAVAVPPPGSGTVGERRAALKPVLAPVCQPPVVLSSPPAARTVCPGATVTFEVVNSGYPNVTYQWRRNGVNIVNGGRFSGATTATLTVTADSSDNGLAFTCWISNPCGVALSGMATLTVSPAAPAAPTNVNATDGTVCGAVNVTWTAAANAVTYRVYRAAVNNTASAVQIGTTGGTFHQDSTAAAGAAYFYWVKAVNGCGESAFSASNAGNRGDAPGAPTGVTASDGTSCTSVTVAWNAVGGASGYGVYRSTTDDFAQATLLSLPAGLSYVDTGAQAGVAYRYWVDARNICGPGARTGPVIGMKSQPPEPTGLTAEVIGNQCDRIRLTWTAPIGATAHAVYRGETGDFAGAALLSASAASPFTDSTITGGRTYFYWVTATTSCGTSPPLGPVSMFATEPVWIAVHPTRTTGIRNEPVTMIVQAAGTGPLTYRWYRGVFGSFSALNDNSTYQGVTTPTLTIARSQDGDGYQYRCRVTNACGFEDSDAAVLETSAHSCRAGAITRQPSGRTVCAGTAMWVTVETSATYPVTYVWRKDGVVIPWATTHTVPIASASAADAGVYTCTVSNGCGGPVTSQSATVTVNSPPTITQQPADGARCVGGAINFIVSATSNQPISYQWRKDGVALGGAVQSWLPVLVQSAANAGVYDCVVSNGCGSVTSAPATLTVGTGTPAITSQPLGASKCAGDSHTFTVSATGGALSYQWLRNSQPVAGATGSVLSIAPLSGSDTGTYTCLVTNPCGTATSAGAVLNVNIVPYAITSPFDNIRCVGQSVSFQAVFGGTGVIHQWRKDGVNIPGANAGVYTIASVTTASAGVYDCVGTSACGTGVSAPATLTVSVTPTVQRQPTGGAVCAGQPHTFSVEAFAGGPLSYQWFRNGMMILGANGSTLEIASASPGDAGQYWCRVSNVCGQEVYTDSAVLSVQPANPTITGQPTGATLAPGASLTMTVTATGAAGYQWRRDGAEIPGATAAAYTIVSAGAADRGGYDCVVTGACGGQAVSTVAQVVVNVGDFNGSGTTTVQDLFDFFAAYFAGDMRADVNGSGTLTVQDLFEFLSAYFGA